MNRQREQEPRNIGDMTIPGLNPFEILERGEQLPNAGILVQAAVREDLGNGTFRFFDYNGITSLNQGPQRSAMVCFSRVWDFAVGYEEPDSPNQRVNPPDRIGNAALLPLPWGTFRDITLENGGHILVSKLHRVERGPRVIEEIERDSFNERLLARVFAAGAYTEAIEATKAVLSQLCRLDPDDVSTAVISIRAAFPYAPYQRVSDPKPVAP